MPMRDTFSSSNVPGCCTILHVNSLTHQEEAVVHRAVVRNRHGSVTLFAIDDGECISEHQSHNDELVLVLEGEIELLLAGTPFHMKKGEVRHIKPYTLHLVRGIRGGKILLIILRNPPPEDKPKPLSRRVSHEQRPDRTRFRSP